MGLKFKKVLIVDDDTDFRVIVKKILETQGMVVKEAVDLNSAKEAINAYPPDCVLLDINLSAQETGHSLLKERQENPNLYSFPIIVVSADSRAEMVKQSILYGADDFLLKPIKQTWLIQRLRKHLMKTDLLKKIPPLSLSEVNLQMSANMNQIGEAECGILSQAKFLKDARIRILGGPLTGVDLHEMRALEGGQTQVNGLFQNIFTMLGITEKASDQIRKIKAQWRSK